VPKHAATGLVFCAFLLFLAAPSCGGGDPAAPGKPTGGDGGPRNPAPLTCGNGQVDPGEACDDGNTVGGDGCEVTCTPTSGASTTCKVLAPLASGTCSVTAGGAARLITGTVLTPDMIYRGGSVLVDDKGTIACVGCACEGQAEGATVITCPTGVVSPALINPHDHITYAQNPPYNDTGERYEHRHDWREGKNGHTKISTPGSASADQIRWAELRFLMGGAASTVGSGSVAGLLRNLDKSADELGLNQKAVDFDTFPLGDSNGTQLASGCGYPAINKSASIAGDDAYLPHVAEGINAFATNEFTCVSGTANGAQDLVSAKTALIHSVGLTAPDYADIGKLGGTVIWSPRSNITLYGDTAIVPEAARLGVRIALGTDWIATGSMNLLRELRCADSVNKTYFAGFFTDQALWRMVTVDAARATATDDAIGVLSPGKVGDVAIFDGRTHADFRAVIDAEPQDVVMVMRGGKVLYGDASLVSGAGGATCDTLDVCGTPKEVCLQDEFGKNFSALKAAVGSIYPAFFCGTPDKEPSCVPRRTTSVQGSTIYDGTPSPTDADGDGIDDAKDDCPRAFNPVRPMDGGKQADFDGDGQGDACDPCPLEAGVTACKAFDPNDSDGDGVANGTDDCPNAADPAQADADGDHKGDACDPCPNVANPGALACPGSIYDIKKGTIAPGAEVSVASQLVTARNASGFYLQTKSGDPGYAGTDYSGIYVFATGNTVKAGDRVSITTSTVQNFNGQIQLTGAQVSVVTSAGEAPPDPVAALSSDVATGGPRAAALEGVIVTVAQATVSDVSPPPGAGDTAPINEFVVDGSLRVNDALYLTAPFPAVGDVYTSLTGILEYRNANSKLEPRSAADVVLGPPRLTAFNEPSSFVRVGQSAVPTLPTPLAVRLTHAALADTFVAVTSSDEQSLTVVGGGVTVLAGQSSAPLSVNGLAQAASVTLTATLGTDTQTATVRVVDAAEQPALASLTPDPATVAPGGTTTFTVTLDLPSPAGGTTVALALDPTNAGTIPASVTVAQDQTTATFDYVDASVVSGATLTATLGAVAKTAQIQVQAPTGHLVINEVNYDDVGADTAEFVELYNASSGPISLTGYSLVLVNGSNNAVYKTVDLSAAGTLDPGQYLVVCSPPVVSSVPAGQKTLDLGTDSAGVIQNGSPDGLAIVSNGALVDALSYEGAMTAAVVPGVGTVSLVEGTVLPTNVADSNTATGSLCRIPSGTDTNNAATDWKFSTTVTPGAPNVP